MPTKSCESCGKEFAARLNKIRTCGTSCRNKLISKERQESFVEKKTCEVCGDGFEVGAADRARRTCSTECSYALRSDHRKDRIRLSCATCGEDFERKRSEVSTDASNYCSVGCLYDRNKVGTTRPCEVCGTSFSTPPSQMHVRTCSMQCGLQVRVNPQAKEKVEAVCSQCGVVFLEHESHAGRRIFCSHDCREAHPSTAARKVANATGDKNPNWAGDSVIRTVSATGRKYVRQLPHVEAERVVRRKRVILQATPGWADIEAMQSIYRAAQALTKTSGVVHHVDHIVPLTSKLVCGLHVQNNLQVLPGGENLKKHNRSWPDMP